MASVSGCQPKPHWPEAISYPESSGFLVSDLYSYPADQEARRRWDRYETGWEIIDPPLHQPCSPLQEQQSWWGRRWRSSSPPPPLSQRFKFNAWSGNNLATNLFHFQDWFWQENYHFDFYVGEKYMECLLVDFSDFNRGSIGWGNPIISNDRLWNLNWFPPLLQEGSPCGLILVRDR